MASAFLALAHGSREEYDALSESLKKSPAGELCRLYLENRDPGLLDQAGLILTGSRDWYTYLGRAL